MTAPLCTIQFNGFEKYLMVDLCNRRSDVLVKVVHQKCPFDIRDMMGRWHFRRAILVWKSGIQLRNRQLHFFFNPFNVLEWNLGVHSNMQSLVKTLSHYFPNTQLNTTQSDVGLQRLNCLYAILNMPSNLMEIRCFESDDVYDILKALYKNTIYLFFNSR